MTNVWYYLLYAVFCFFVGFVVSRVISRSSVDYDGTLNVSANDARLIYELEITKDPELFKEQKSIVLEVRKVSGS